MFMRCNNGKYTVCCIDKIRIERFYYLDGFVVET